MLFAFMSFGKPPTVSRATVLMAEIMSNLIDRVSRQGGGNPVRKRALAAKFNAVREKNGGLRTAVG